MFFYDYVYMDRIKLVAPWYTYCSLELHFCIKNAVAVAHSL